MRKPIGNKWYASRALFEVLKTYQADEMERLLLRDLVDEAAEVVVECKVSGAAGEAWRRNWLERAAAAGLRPVGGAQ